MSGNNDHTPATTRHRLTFQHFAFIALAIALATRGLVPSSAIAFALLSLPYTLFLARSPFPPRNPAPARFSHSRLFRLYLHSAAVIGLLLPIPYVALSASGPARAAAAEHLFLLSCQVAMEGVTSEDRFSLPVRVFVPVAYNARRMFSIAEWVRAEEGGRGRALAGVNMGLWGFNLFGFLLPVYLPWAFQRYYSSNP